MDNHWLMNSEVLTILRKLRKRLHAEFDITLRFSDEDLEEKLARARNKTVDSETRRMITTLEEYKGQAFTCGEEGPRRFYRGQPILQEVGQRKDIYALIYGEELAQHDAALRGKWKPTQVYRGQPILRDGPGAAPAGRRLYRGRFVGGDGSQ